MNYNMTLLPVFFLCHLSFSNIKDKSTYLSCVLLVDTHTLLSTSAIKLALYGAKTWVFLFCCWCSSSEQCLKHSWCSVNIAKWIKWGEEGKIQHSGHKVVVRVKGEGACMSLPLGRCLLHLVKADFTEVDESRWGRKGWQSTGEWCISIHMDPP